MSASDRGLLARSPTWGVPRWGPLPIRTGRAMFPLAGLRGPSPLPSSPERSGNAQWAGQRTPWRFDCHPAYSGWNATAHGHAAALLLTAAYDAALELNIAVPQVDWRWHRPDARDVAPFGYNWRGDIAPPNIHDTLDIILYAMSVQNPADHKLLHAQIDLVWLLHSRSPLRLPIVLRRIRIFKNEDLMTLENAILREPLTDARLLMVALDPRSFPVYGRTMSSSGQSRLFRSFPDVLAQRAEDHATWDEDDGGESGSSVASQDAPYDLTPLERMEQRARQLERRLRRALDYGDALEQHVLAVEAETKQLEDRYRQMLARRDAAHMLGELIEAGLGVVAPDNGVAGWRAASRGYSVARVERGANSVAFGWSDDATAPSAWPPAV